MLRENPGDSGQRSIGRPGQVSRHLSSSRAAAQSSHSRAPRRVAVRAHRLESQTAIGIERARLLARAVFDWPTGIALPPTGPGENDDLQDVVSRNLNDLKASGGELFAFGSHFHDPAPKPGIDAEFGTKDGMHDIHMNQGNAPHEHDEDNGVFNDGGVILQFADHVTGLFFRFKTQFLPTDENGDRIPGVSKEILAAATPTGSSRPIPVPDEPQPTFPRHITLSAPSSIQLGDDVHKEVVVIGNTTTVPVDSTGWRIVDKNDLADTLNGVQLGAGASALIVLTGKRCTTVEQRRHHQAHESGWRVGSRRELLKSRRGGQVAICDSTPETEVATGVPH